MSLINETGFVDYVSTLINQTIDAISIAQLEQEQKIIDLKSDLLLSDSQIIEKYDLEESIDFNEDITDEEKNMLLQQSVEKHRELIKNYFEKGFVKTIVDKGKLSTKFIFSFTEEDTQKVEIKEEKKNSQKPIPQSLEVKPNKNKIVKKRNSSILKDIKNLKPIELSIKKDILNKNDFNINKNDNFKTKLSVIPLTKSSNKDDDTNSTNTNITSYLELEFRTVID